MGADPAIIKYQVLELGLSFLAQAALHHVHHRQLVVLPHSVYYRVVLVENTLPVELVLLKGTLVSLSILEELRASTVKHSVVPVPLVLLVSPFSVEDAPARLDTVSKITLIPAAVRPPESSSSISFAAFELSLIDVAFLSSPSVDSTAFLFIEPELSDIVIPGGEVEFSLALQLSVMELAVNDFVGIFEEADAFAVRAVDLGFSNVDDFWIFKELGGVEGWVEAENERGAVLDDEEFFEFELDVPEFSADEGSLIVEVVEIELGLL